MMWVFVQKMIHDVQVRSLSRHHISGVALIAILFEIFYFAGFFEESHPWEPTLFIILYSFNLVAIISATLLLFILFITKKNEIILLISLAIFSWFLGSFFWISYVFILGNPVTYPCIAELTFRGFHLLMIPLLIFLLKMNNITIIKPTLICVPFLTFFPIFHTRFSPVSINALIYSTVFLFITSITIVLTFNLLLKKRYPLVGIGLLMIAAADISFAIICISNPESFVFMLDPIWFFGFSLISYAAISHEVRGDFP